jgi:hypothetical protein
MEQQLRNELVHLRLSALQRRARECGVPEAVLDEAVDSDDPKSAVTAMIVAHLLVGSERESKPQSAPEQEPKSLPPQPQPKWGEVSGRMSQTYTRPLSQLLDAHTIGQIGDEPTTKDLDTFEPMWEGSDTFNDVTFGSGAPGAVHACSRTGYKCTRLTVALTVCSVTFRTTLSLGCLRYRFRK